MGGWNTSRRPLGTNLPSVTQTVAGRRRRPQVVPAVRDDDGVWTVVGEPGWKNAQFLWSVDVFVQSEGDVVTNDIDRSILAQV